MVDVLTDNKNRSAAEVRLAFNKNGGNLGEKGCVAFMFERKGILIANRLDQEFSEDEMLLAAIEAGAEEMEAGDEAFEIVTAPNDLEKVKEALEQEGYNFETAELTMIANTKSQLVERMPFK